MYGLLALRQKRLDEAVGIRRITSQVGLLLECYDKTRQRERAELAETLSKVAGKSFYLGVIQGARERIKAIRGQVTIDTPLAEAETLLDEARLLEEQIRVAMAAINS